MNAPAYVPGHFSCPACAFGVTRVALSALDGGMSPDTSDPGVCPNDGWVLEPVSYLERYRDVMALIDSLEARPDGLEILRWMQAYSNRGPAKVTLASEHIGVLVGMLATVVALQRARVAIPFVAIHPAEAAALMAAVERFSGVPLPGSDDGGPRGDPAFDVRNPRRS